MVGVSADAAEAAASAATWDVLECAVWMVMVVFDLVVDGGGIDVMLILVKVLMDVFEGLLVIDWERFTTDGAAFFESLSNEASEFVNEVVRCVGLIVVNGGGVDFIIGVGLIVGFVVLVMVVL